MVIVTHGDVETKPPLDRTDTFEALEDAVRWWGCDVPEDPGAGELAEILDEIAERLVGDRSSQPYPSAAMSLAQAAEALRAVARLGSLLPTISLWHLRTALRQEGFARSELVAQRDLQPATSPL